MTTFAPEDIQSTFDFTSAVELLHRAQQANDIPPYPYGEPELRIIPKEGYGYRGARNFGYWIKQASKGLYPNFNMAQDAGRLTVMETYSDYLPALRKYKQYLKQGGKQRVKDFDELIPKLEEQLGPLEEFEETENDKIRRKWYNKAIRTDVDEFGATLDALTGEPVIMEPFPFDAIDDNARKYQWQYDVIPPYGELKHEADPMTTAKAMPSQYNQAMPPFLRGQ